MNKNSQCFDCANFRCESNLSMDKCTVFSYGIPDALQFNLVTCRDFIKHGDTTKKVSLNGFGLSTLE